MNNIWLIMKKMLHQLKKESEGTPYLPIEMSHFIFAVSVLKARDSLECFRNSKDRDWIY